MGTPGSPKLYKKELIKMPRRKSHRRRQNHRKLEPETNLKDPTSIEPNVNTEEESYKILQDLKEISGKVISDKSAKINAPEYSNLLDNWMTFTNNMNSQAMENIKEHQNDYERMYSNWRNLSDAIITELTTTVQRNDDYHELYDVWKNNSNKISGQLAKMSENGNNLYESFITTWRDHSEVITSQFLGLNELDESPAEGVYGSWLEFNKRLSNEIVQLITGNHTDQDSLTNIWSEFNEKVINFMNSSREGNKDTYGKFSLTYSKFANTFRENMKKFYQEHECELEKLRNVYQHQIENTNSRIASMFKNVSSDYEKIFRGYLERIIDFRGNLQLFSVMDSHSLYSEIGDLKDKIKQLGNRLNKLEKK